MHRPHSIRKRPINIRPGPLRAAKVTDKKGPGLFQNVLRQPMPPLKKHWTTVLGQAAGHPAAFGIVIFYAVLWLSFDRRSFDWNAVATLGVWMMTLFIQRSNRRDTLALHAKLDELLRVDSSARSELARLDEQEPEAIEAHRDTEVRRSAPANAEARP